MNLNDYITYLIKVAENYNSNSKELDIVYASTDSLSAKIKIKVRFALALNPNISKELFEFLLEGILYVEELRKNPAWELFCLEDPTVKSRYKKIYSHYLAGLEKLTAPSN